MIREAIEAVLSGRGLSYEEARASMDEIMRGEASAAQIASFLTALRMKGESIDEITGCARSMRGHALSLPHAYEVLDVVGTGGDRAYSFNISTLAGVIAASGGVKVAKHGNRSVSSKCGSADLLEALGVNLNLPPEKSAAVLDEVGICFLFAPLYHASMRHAAPVRKDLGVRTIFNILGPLANPAGATLQLLGVYDRALVEPLARVLSNLGVTRAMVVYGDDCLDEISLGATTTVCELKEGVFTTYTLDPHALGFSYCGRGELVGGDASENAAIARAVLGGERGAKRDVTLINAGACLFLGGKASSLAEGAALAAELVDSGRALATLDLFIEATKELAS